MKTRLKVKEKRMREGKYKGQRGQSALMNKNKLLFTGGIFLVSISVHMAGFLTIKGIADDGIAVLWKAVFPLFLGMLGIICMGSCILRRQLLGSLLYLGGIYLGIQLILSFLMGGIAVFLEHTFAMGGEAVKNTMDMIIRVIQIPVRAGGSIFLMERLIGSSIWSLKLLIKLSTAFAIYTMIQSLAGLMGYTMFFLIVRVLAAGIIAVILWSYIYLECRRSGEQDEA